MNKLLRILLAVLLVAVLVVGVVACGEDDTPATDTQQTDTPANDNKDDNKDDTPAHTHSYAAATCTAPKTCSCGATEGEALGHTWVDADCDTPKTCSVCGATEGEALGHAWGEWVETKAPTATEAGEDTRTCGTCGATETRVGAPATGGGEEPPAHTHNWKDADCLNPKTCLDCGETEGEALGHAEKTIAGTAANCTDAGLTDGVVCERCGEELVAQEVIPALGHSYGEWITIQEPTAEEDGAKYRTCPVCGDVQNEVIPALGQGEWVEYNVGLNTEGIKILGERNGTKSSDGKIWLDWAGSGIEMNVHLDVTFDVRLFVQAMNGDEGAVCTFAVYVDGEFKGTYDVQCGLTEQTIDIPNVPYGDHVIRVVKVTDYTVTSAEILMVYMDGAFLTTPADNDMYIEFIGDSVTTGYDNLTKSYAWAVAESFNADYAITAMNGADLATMAAAYEKINPLRDPMAVYRFNREADVVVINLGAEDYALDAMMGDSKPDAFQAAYEAFLANVRYWNADAKILCVYGAANDGYGAAIEAAAAGKAGVYTLKLDTTAESAGEEGIAVPSATEQAAYAVAITAKINEIKDDVIAGDEPVVGEGSVTDWNS